MTRRCRKRERIVWSPVWGKEYEKWATSFLWKNKWRCDPVNDMDDLLQEAYLTFAHVADTYPRVIEPKHFMALFKRAMTNKMHDKSCRYNRRRGTVEAPISTDVYEVFAGRIGEVTNGGYLAALLNEAPEELKLVLAMLADGRLDEAKQRHKLEPRENLSMRACRLLGLNPDLDPILEIKRLLT